MKRFVLLILIFLLIPFQIFAERTDYAVRDKSQLTIVSDKNLQEKDILRYKHFNNKGSSGEVDVKLPSVSYEIEVIFTVVETNVIELCGPIGETPWNEGEQLDANDCVDSPATAGSILTAKREPSSNGTWHWHFLSITGAWTDTGATD